MEEKNILQTPFFQVPKVIFELWRSKKMSSTAFSIYILIFDRYRLSLVNDFKDKKDDIHVKYSYEELKEELKITNNRSISNAIKELESLELIEKKRNFNNSNSYYINTSVPKDTNTSVPNDTNVSVLKDTSASVPKWQTNNNYLNKNYKNKNNLNNNYKDSCCNIDIHYKKEFESILKDCIQDKKLLNELVTYNRDIEYIKLLKDNYIKKGNNIGYLIKGIKEPYDFTVKEKVSIKKRKVADLSEKGWHWKEYKVRINNPQESYITRRLRELQKQEEGQGKQCDYIETDEEMEDFPF